MRPQHASYLLHRLYARAHGLSAPAIQKLTCPARVNIIPESLEVFLEKVTSNGFQVVSHQVRQFRLLSIRKIFGTLEQAPPGMLENVHVYSLSAQFFRL